MKLTCNELKSVITQLLWNRVYKSDGEVRINLEHITDEYVEFLRSELQKHGLVMYRDDVVHLPNDYIVRYDSL